MDSLISPPTTLAMFNLSGWELIILGIVLLLIFGRKVPDIARSLGKGVVEFKKGLRDVQDSVDKSEQAPQYPQNQHNQQYSQNQPASQAQIPPATQQPAPGTGSQPNTFSQPQSGQNPYSQGDFRQGG